MAFNLLETVRGYLTPDLVNQTAANFGETPENITKAVDAGLPLVLSTFVSRAEKGDAHALNHDAKEALKAHVLDNPARLLGGGLGSLFPGGWDRIQRMFAGNAGVVVSQLANSSGLKPGSVQGLLGMLMPLSLAVLGRHAQDANLVPQTLPAFMANQKESITAALPAGLSSGRGVTGQKVPEPVRLETPPPVSSPGPAKRGAVSWLPLVLLLGLGAIAIVWYWDNRGKKTMVQSKMKEETPATAPAQAPPSVRQYTQVRLVNGTLINAYKGGVEDGLVACLDNAACVAGKDKWFDFDNINFETGSAQLTAESKAQVQNLVAILNAYPKAKVKIGGYTDKVGADAANLKLSQQRADAVLVAIRGAGANSAQLLGAEGYGSQFARAAATAPDEERSKDRRIAVQLAEK